MKNLLAVLVAVFVVSGCTSIGNTELGDVAKNPGEYIGEEIILTGEIKSKANPNSFSYDEEINENVVGNETMQIATFGKELGNLNGRIDMAGKCYQNDYASKVDVRGEISSYSTCDCEIKEKTIEKERIDAYIHIGDNGNVNKSLDIRYIDNKSVKDYVKADFYIEENNYLEYANKEFVKLDRSKLSRIDNHTDFDLSKLRLDSVFPLDENKRIYFDNNGERVEYHPQLLLGHGYKIGVSDDVISVANYETLNTIKEERRKESKELEEVCKMEDSISNQKDDIESITTYRGCIDEPQERFVFSCNEVVKQHE